MRVAIVTHDFPVVSENFVMEAVTGLLARGHDAHVFRFFPAAHDREQQRAAIEANGLEGRVHSARAPANVLREPFEAARRAGDALAAGAGDPVKAAGILLRAAAIARHEPFDVVHCQFATLGLDGLALRKVGALGDVALVVHLRGYDLTTYVREHGPSVYDELWRSADLFLPNSGHFARVATEQGAPPDRIRVVGSPVDLATFPYREPRVDDGTVRLVCVGRLVPKKGFADAIEALSRLRSAGVSVTLDVIGDGELLGGLEARAASLGVAGQVRFHGELPSAEVAKRLAEADLMIAPSVTAPNGDQDGPLNTLKEAMARGLPVISTWHGGIPELVEDGVSGYLVEERDPAGIAAAVRRLIAERGRWSEMGRAGREAVQAGFEKDRITGLLEDAYAEAIERRLSGGRAPRR